MSDVSDLVKALPRELQLHVYGLYRERLRRRARLALVLLKCERWAQATGVWIESMELVPQGAMRALRDMRSILSGDSEGDVAALHAALLRMGVREGFLHGFERAARERLLPPLYRSSSTVRSRLAYKPRVYALTPDCVSSTWYAFVIRPGDVRYAAYHVFMSPKGLELSDFVWRRWMDADWPGDLGEAVGEVAGQRMPDGPGEGPCDVMVGSCAEGRFSPALVSAVGPGEDLRGVMDATRWRAARRAEPEFAAALADIANLPGPGPP